MSNITRIKNNQITDNTIEYTKIKDGTLVGVNFNANLTLNSNVTILGNLTVANSFAQLNSINTYINDPVVVFNNNYVGSPTYDIGLLINRNLSALPMYGAVNAAWVWKESDAAFYGIMTTETGTTAGAIDNSGFANLFIGNIQANTIHIVDTTRSHSSDQGALVVDGGLGVGGNVNITGNVKVFQGNTVFANGLNSSGLDTGAVVVKGGVAIQQDLNVGGIFNLTGDAFLSGNLTVLGQETIIGTADLTIFDSIINLHTFANLAQLTYDDGKDIGLKLHYYDGTDGVAFLGRANDTKFLEFYGAGTDTSNVFAGTDYGTIKAGEFFSANTTDSTGETTGAIRTSGGIGVASNVFVGKSATFNSTQSSNQDFKVQGVNSTNLIWGRASSTYDQVLIGNTANAGDFVLGAKLTINSTDSMILPTGTSAQRPGSAGGTDTEGMFRYSTTVSAPEFYDGSSWNPLITQFTIITDENFNGDDVTTNFTMSGTSTTAATIVSINGVIQIPTIAYSVTGTTLSFTEAPATGDLIDVRRLATTTIVTNITSTNGYMGFQVDNNGAYVYTGFASTSPTTYWEPRGAEVASAANLCFCNNANQSYCIDAFEANTYRSAKYLVQVSTNTASQISEVLMIQGNGSTTLVEYGVVGTGGNIGICSSGFGIPPIVIEGVDYTKNHGKLFFTTAVANVTVRLKKDYVLV